MKKILGKTGFEIPAAGCGSFSIVSLTLMADHRVIDGFLVAAFLKRLKEIPENPS